MLEDVLDAVGNLRNKGRQIKLVNGRLFLRDSALSVLHSNLRDVLARRRYFIDRNNSLGMLKKYLSEHHYYLVEDGRVWSGYLLNVKANEIFIPISNGRLVDGVEHLVYGDPSIASNSGIKLFEIGRYVAEFDYGVSKYKIHLRAFDRFVRCFRGSEGITLRECLFEMYRCIKRAELSGSYNVNALKRKLERLKVRDKSGKRGVLEGKRPSYLYSRGDKNYIFVRNFDEIFYCQPV